MSSYSTELDSSKERVVADFRTLISGAEDLLRSTASYSGDGIDVARGKFRRYLEGARASLSDVEDLAIARYDLASESTDAFVRGNPWQAVGIAVAAGLFIGFMARR